MRRILVSLIATLIAMLSIEGAAQVALSSAAPDVWTFRASAPSPYANADYYTPEFLAESRDQYGASYTPEGTRLVLPRDYGGVYMSAHGGQRTTTSQPDAAHTLYLFGGSTIYNPDVPDEYTVASLLQQRTGYRVENMGMLSVTTTQQWERLQTVTLKASDLVLFYGGVNDVFQGVYMGRPDGWMVGDNRARRTSRDDILEAFGHLAFVQIALRPQYSAPEYLANPDALVKENARRYADAIADARAYTEASGARFVSVLQPHLFMREPSVYERELLSNPNIIPPGLQEAYASAYPSLRDASDVDLSALFTDEPDLYLDFCHLAHEGNAHIAIALSTLVD